MKNTFCVLYEFKYFGATCLFGGTFLQTEQEKMSLVDYNKAIKQIQKEVRETKVGTISCINAEDAYIQGPFVSCILNLTQLQKKLRRSGKTFLIRYVEFNSERQYQLGHYIFTNEEKISSPTLDPVATFKAFVKKLQNTIKEKMDKKTSKIIITYIYELQ